jgi:hypothetical protein
VVPIRKVLPFDNLSAPHSGSEAWTDAACDVQTTVPVTGSNSNAACG